MRFGQWVAVAIVAMAVSSGTAVHASDGWSDCFSTAAIPGTNGTIVLTGHAGQSVSEPFALERGNAIVTIDVAPGGDGYLNIELLAFPGDASDYLVLLESAPYQASLTSSVYDPGTYVLDVDSPGDWSVTIRQ